MKARELLQALAALPAQYQDCPVIISTSSAPAYTRRSYGVLTGKVAKLEIVVVQGVTVILLTD